MLEIQIHRKPMSVNEAWQGRRYKSKAYKAYEKEVMLLLPTEYEIPESGDLAIRIEAGLSRKADLDNVCKPILDIIQKMYGCNDKRFMEIFLVKKIIKKGDGYFNFSIWGIA